MRRRSGRAGGDVRRQPHAARRRADRDGLCRTSVRQLRSRLGDGHAILLGEVLDRDGRRATPIERRRTTPFSRRGDGRAALGPVLREYLVSEAMHALGIPTTRALAAVSTGEPVYRDQELPGAVFTRVASSHVRVGTFQYFAARGDVEAVKRLADYVIDRHNPAPRTPKGRTSRCFRPSWNDRPGSSRVG